MTDKMTHKELVEAFAAQSAKSLDFSQKFIHDVFDIIEEGLVNDEQVRIKGLGIFKLKDVEEREMRNPSDGTTFIKEAHRKVVFRPEKTLRELVNKRYAHLRAKRLKRKMEGEADPSLIETVDPKVESVEKPAPVDPPKEQVETSPEPKRSFLPWLLPLLLVLIILAAIYFAPNRIKRSEIDSLNKNREAVVLLEQNEETFVHIVKAGNTISGISKEYFNRPSLWPNIYRLNNKNLNTPDQLFLGNELLIPKLKGEPFELTKDDSSCIAHGYYLVYEAYKKDNKKEARSYMDQAIKFLPEEGR